MRLPTLLGLLAPPFGALAQHSPAAFDQTAFVEFDGTVARFEWANPHVYLAVETVGDGGERHLQDVKAGPPSQLLPRGFTRDVPRVGDRVTVKANPNRRGPGRVVLGVELTTANGTTFPLHARTLSALGPSESVATSIEGTWVPRPEGYLGLARAMTDWPQTDLARAARAGDRSRMLANQAECIPPGPPALMASSVPITVVVADDTVMFAIDSAGQVQRTVHVGAEHPVDIEPSLLGHSVGRSESGTLVVDTIAFRAHAEGMGFQFPSNDAKHVVERFSLSDDGKHLDYEIVIQDSAYLTAPVTYRTQWDYRPEQVLANAPCDPATATRFLEQE